MRIPETIIEEVSQIDLILGHIIFQRYLHKKAPFTDYSNLDPAVSPSPRPLPLLLFESQVCASANSCNLNAGMAKVLMWPFAFFVVCFY